MVEAVLWQQRIKSDVLTSGHMAHCPSSRQPRRYVVAVAIQGGHCDYLQARDKLAVVGRDSKEAQTLSMLDLTRAWLLAGRNMVVPVAPVDGRDMADDSIGCHRD